MLPQYLRATEFRERIDKAFPKAISKSTFYALVENKTIPGFEKKGRDVVIPFDRVSKALAAAQRYAESRGVKAASNGHHSTEDVLTLLADIRAILRDIHTTMQRLDAKW